MIVESLRGRVRKDFKVLGGFTKFEIKNEGTEWFKKYLRVVKKFHGK
jgi:hypothetical protein